MKAKIGLYITLIVTAIIGVYGIDLGIRVSRGSEGPEILAALIIVLALLWLVNMIFLARRSKNSSQKKPIF